ncbi:MAG: DUF1476 domain-containing protein [Alphaproteobacteria bacterium]|nr:DUF1476 domain-containing protein [Alphaproteobacteria bacterium]
MDQVQSGGLLHTVNMNTFNDERERAFERKFALDQELAFKVTARRNALLARWAAARIGFSGSRAAAYVKDLVESQVAHDDSRSVTTRVMKDLAANGVPVTRDELDARIARFTGRARADIVRNSLR